MNACLWVLLGAAALGQLSNPAARCYFGIKALEVDTPVAKRLGIERTTGVLVGVVRVGSPCERAGLRAGDVIVRFGDVDTPRVNVLQDLMTTANPGTTYRTEVDRQGQQLSLDVVGADPPPVPAKLPQTFDLGLLVAPAGSAAAIRFEIESPVGVVITTVRAGGPGEAAGMQPGDLVLELGGYPTDTVEDYQAAAFLCPLGSQQPVIYVRSQQRQSTTIHVHATPRIDPPWSYVHPNGVFQVQLPPQWYIFAIDQPGVPVERQYTRIISPFARFELKFFKTGRPAPDARQALDTFVEQTLQDGPDRESGRVELRGVPGAWVSMPLDSGERLYRVCFVVAGKRYTLNATAPPLSDPGTLPLPVASIVRAIEFPPRIASDSAPSGSVTRDDPADSPGADLPHDSAKPSEPTEPPSSRPPADWRRVRAGNISFHLPPNWSGSQFNAADAGLWYLGKQLFPESSFRLDRDTTVEDVRQNATLRDRSETRVGGRPATLYLVERTDAFAETGFIVVSVDPAGAPVIFSAFAPTNRFEVVAPVLRQILDSVQFGTNNGLAPSTHGPSRTSKRDPAAPQPPTDEPGARP